MFSKFAIFALPVVAIRLPGLPEGDHLIREESAPLTDRYGGINLNTVEKRDDEDHHIYGHEDIAMEEADDDMGAERKPQFFNQGAQFQNDDLWGSSSFVQMKNIDNHWHREESDRLTDRYGGINLNTVEERDEEDKHVYGDEDIAREEADDEVEGFEGIQNGLRKPRFFNNGAQFQNDDLWGSSS